MKATETTNALILHLDQNNLDVDTKKTLLENFQDFFKQTQDWKEKAKALTVTDISQIREMKMAKEARLALKNIRVNTEHTRKRLKEESLRKGQTIDAIAKIITNEIIPIEKHLEEQEKFVERIEAERKEKLKVERVKLLTPYEVDVQFIDIANMPEESFNQLLESSKISFEQKQEAIKKAEEERVKKEMEEKEYQLRLSETRPYSQFLTGNELFIGMPEDVYISLLSDLKKQKAEFDIEQEKIRLENERLKKEAEEREKQLAAERAKAEAERKAIEEKARIEREKAEAEARKLKAEQDAKLKREREEREKIEAELKAKKEAEEKAIREAKEKEEAERKAKEKAAKAPRKQKLNIWIDSLSIEAPTGLDNDETAKEIIDKFNSFKKWAKSQVENI